jgi:hypothetical protein
MTNDRLSTLVQASSQIFFVRQDYPDFRSERVEPDSL